MNYLTLNRRPLKLFEELSHWEDLLQPFPKPFFFDLPTSNSVTINAYEDDGNLFIDANVSGIPKENINITYKDDILTIEGQIEEKEESEDKNYIRKEMHREHFKRDIPIAIDIDIEKISAEHKDGILKLTLPKKGKTDKDNAGKIIEIK